jgi:signal transduction histidine kinase
MSGFRQAVVQLTIKYSLIFFAFIWLFSGGMYLWVNNSLGEGYVDRINNALELQNSTPAHQTELSDSAASIAADITLDRLRNILLAINVAALFAVPFIAYFIAKRTLNPLIESQKSQQRFVANASHELRTPLAVMLADLDWADKKERNITEYKTTIANTKTEVQRMNTLVASLLTLAQLSDKITLTKEAVEINLLIQKAILYYEDAAEGRSLLINAHLDAKTVSGDKRLLDIVFRNLINNAIKYAKPNTTIDIETQTMDNTTTIIFRNKADNLTGDQLSNLFDRFYQSEVHQSNGGFGLGLAIVKQIIDMHGGSVDIRYAAQNHQIEIQTILN